MTTMTVMPTGTADWTVDDLDLLPDDGLQYQDAGVRSYWIVDPEAPSIIALELVDGQYVTVTEAIGDEAVNLEKPFPSPLSRRT